MDINEKIHRKGLKLTQPRQKILNILANHPHPMSFEDYASIDPHLDKSTFYRNMQTFETAQIVQGIESEDGRRYYEIIEDVHPHFICQVCHSITCLSPVITPKISGYQINSITYKGICPQC